MFNIDMSGIYIALIETDPTNRTKPRCVAVRDTSGNWVQTDDFSIVKLYPRVDSSTAIQHAESMGAALSRCNITHLASMGVVDQDQLRVCGYHVSTNEPAFILTVVRHDSMERFTAVTRDTTEYIRHMGDRVDQLCSTEADTETSFLSGGIPMCNKDQLVYFAITDGDVTRYIGRAKTILAGLFEERVVARNANAPEHWIPEHDDIVKYVASLDSEILYRWGFKDLAQIDVVVMSYRSHDAHVELRRNNVITGPVPLQNMGTKKVDLYSGIPTLEAYRLANKPAPTFSEIMDEIQIVFVDNLRPTTTDGVSLGWDFIYSKAVTQDVATRVTEAMFEKGWTIVFSSDRLEFQLSSN